MNRPAATWRIGTTNSPAPLSFCVEERRPSFTVHLSVIDQVSWMKSAVSLADVSPGSLKRARVTR